MPDDNAEFVQIPKKMETVESPPARSGQFQGGPSNFDPSKPMSYVAVEMDETGQERIIRRVDRDNSWGSKPSEPEAVESNTEVTNVSKPEQPIKAVPVTFTDFGRLTVPYNDAFVQDNCVVLIYSKDSLFQYTPPVSFDSPISIEFKGKKMEAYYLGIQFSRPGSNEVFLVLLLKD